MNSILHGLLFRLALWVWPFVFGLAALAQATAFTYQGRLGVDGVPANGSYDLRFSIYDAATAGTPVGSPFTTNGVPVSNGLFTVTLDVGAGVFTGPDRWLSIEVATNGVGVFSGLTPRQKLTASPYAIHAGNALTAVTIAADGVTSSTIADGSITASDVSSSLLDGTFWKLGGNSGAGSFLGSVDNQPVELRANNQPALRLLPRTLSPSLVGGHASNTVNAGIPGAFIGGGGLPDSRNLISGSHAAIVGGYGNRAHGPGSFVGGGTSNQVESTATFVGGGSGNAATKPYATIGGGYANLALETNGTIGGGFANYLGGTVGASTIGGGQGNRVLFAQAAAIGGGMQNQIAGTVHLATVGGGYQNYIQTNGGRGTIAGGGDNLLTGFAGSIGGGTFNLVHGDYAAVGGGRRNEALGVNATVGGGAQNIASGLFSVVGGGTNNVAGGFGSVVGGGTDNYITNRFAISTTIAGGAGNFLGSESVGSTIGGGVRNAIETFSQWSVIAGGAANTNAFGVTRGVISGGQENRVTGSYGTIPGGLYNEAGDAALAAGSAAKARHRGSWVWADNAAGFDLIGDYTGADFASTRTNQFLVRASGGVGINTNNPQATLHVRGNIAADALRAPGAGVNTGTFAFVHRAAGTNTAGHITSLDHPLCNGDSGAILIVTHNWTADNSANKYHPQVVGVYYTGGRWNLFHEDNATPMEVGDAFNILVIKP